MRARLQASKGHGLSPTPIWGKEKESKMDLGSSSLLTGCVTLREMLSFSGLRIPDYVGRGCG